MMLNILTVWDVPLKMSKVKHSVDDTDLLSITEYDKMGRLFREWLPGVSESGNCGAFVEAEELKNSSVLSNGNDVMPYTKKRYMKIRL